MLNSKYNIFYIYSIINYDINNFLKNLNLNTNKIKFRIEIIYKFNLFFVIYLNK